MRSHFRHFRHPEHARLVAACGLLMALAACKSDNNSAPLVATTIEVGASAQAQTGTVGLPLTQPIVVTVLDQDGNPVANATVTWQVTAGGGTVSSSSSITGSTGNASEIWTLGTVAGPDSLALSVSNGVSTTVGATAVAGPVNAIAKVSGDGQTIGAGTTSLPLIVVVTDVYGNGVPNATVSWSVQGGGTLNPVSTTTDSRGQSQVTLTSDPTPATYMVTASVIGASNPVTFTLTAN